MARLRAVFFDAFGTLLDARGLHLEAAERVLALLGLGERLSAAELHEMWDEHIMELWRPERFTTTDEVLRASLQTALRDLGHDVGPRELDLSMDELFGIFRGRVGLYDGARELLSFCRSLGLRTGMISDASPSLLRHLLEKHCLVELLDVLLISDEMGLIKPDPRAFNTALRAIGCEAEEAMMVGDAVRDVERAKRVGMLAALVVHSKEAMRGLAAEPDIVVSSLAELKGPIAALREGDG